MTGMARGSTVVVLLVGGAVPPAAQSILVSETLLTFDASDEYDAVLSGPDLVFTSRQLGTEDIFHIDPLGSVSPLIVGPGKQNDADIEDGLMVYVDYRSGNANIHYFNLVTGTGAILTVDSSAETDPAVSGTLVAYVSRQLGSPDIFVRDLATGSLFILAATPAIENAPSIDGALVAWQSTTLGDVDVMASLVGAAPFVVAGGPGTQGLPSVSGTLIAYLSDGDVAVYNHSTGITTQITSDSYDQSRVLLDGTHLFWTDDRNGNDDVFVHDLTTGQTYQLTSDPSYQVLTDADAGRVQFPPGYSTHSSSTTTRSDRAPAAIP